MTATKRHGPKERKKWAARWRASGLSGRAFADKHGLQVESIYRWGREFPDDEPQREAFAEVIVKSESRPSSPAVEVVLANGRTVRVVGDVDANQLRAVVEALES